MKKIFTIFGSILLLTTIGYFLFFNNPFSTSDKTITSNPAEYQSFDPLTSSPTSFSFTGFLKRLVDAVIKTSPTKYKGVNGNKYGSTGGTVCIASPGDVGSFTINTALLLPETEYHYRGFGKNATGNGYTADATFTTGASGGGGTSGAVGQPGNHITDTPILISPTSSNITDAKATLGATVDSAGNPATILMRGICYGLNSNPSLDDTSVTANGGAVCIISDGSTGAFTVETAILNPKKTYHYRGFAKNGTGYGYTADATFTTGASGGGGTSGAVGQPGNHITDTPTVDSPNANNITDVGATLGANVSDPGTPATILLRGVCYGLNANPSPLSPNSQNYLPDLTAERTSPSVVTVNEATTFSSTIKNRGGSSTIDNFNYFFQINTSSELATFRPGTYGGVGSLNGGGELVGSGTFSGTGGTVGVGGTLGGGGTLGTSGTTGGTTGTYTGNGTLGTSGTTGGTTGTLGNTGTLATNGTTSGTTRTYGNTSVWGSVVNTVGSVVNGVVNFIVRLFGGTASGATTTIIDLPSAQMAPLDAGQNNTATMSYTFSTLGTYQMRACADLSSSADTGVITEGNENNNCGPWVTVKVVQPQCMDGLDNDKDKLIDEADPACHLQGNLNLDYVPTHNSETNYPGWLPNNGGAICIATTGIDSGATGPFTIQTQTLLSGTTYHYRGYATNATGTGYTNDATFKTTGPDSGIPISPGVSNPQVIINAPTVDSPTSTAINNTSATLGARVSSLGTPPSLSSRGVCYSLTGNDFLPTYLPDLTAGAPSPYLVPVNNASTFYSTIKNQGSNPVLNNFNYFFQIEGIDTDLSGTTTNTTTTNTVPTVTSPTIKNGSNSAQLSANITSLGTPATVTERFFYYGTSPSPTTNKSSLGGPITTGVYGVVITNSGNFLPNTTYYFRGCATNATGTGCSTDGTFTTTATGMFAVEINSATKNSSLSITNKFLNLLSDIFNNKAIAATTVVIDLPSRTMTPLDAGVSKQGSTTYTFTTIGTYRMRACSDKINSGDAGVITEGNENNNCGPWTIITVTDKQIPLPSITECNDKVDNDKDGLIDRNDPECHIGGDLLNEYVETHNDEANAPASLTECNDKVDNDKDGLIDSADPECHYDGNLKNDYVPTHNDEANAPASLTECNDKVDNDKDGLIDRNDPACHYDGDLTATYVPTHDDEANPPQSPVAVNKCSLIDQNPLIFTDAEKARLAILLRKFYLIAQTLKTEDDIASIYSDIEQYNDLMKNSNDLTKECYLETNDNSGFIDFCNRNPNYCNPVPKNSNPTNTYTAEFNTLANTHWYFFADGENGQIAGNIKHGNPWFHKTIGGTFPYDKTPYIDPKNNNIYYSGYFDYNWLVSEITGLVKDKILAPQGEWNAGQEIRNCKAVAGYYYGTYGTNGDCNDFNTSANRVGTDCYNVNLDRDGTSSDQNNSPWPNQTIIEGGCKWQYGVYATEAEKILKIW